MSKQPGALDSVLAPLATTGAQFWLRTLVWGLLGVSVLALLLVGADQPANPHVLSAGVVAASRAHSRPSRVAGFNQVGFHIIESAIGGTGRPWCALLADTADRQHRGMMGRKDLGGYDAMVFRFAADTTVPFYNKDVPISLSLAWFDGAGVFVGAGELALCRAKCPLVQPPQSEPFRYVIEVPNGGLHHLGIGPGSVLVVGGTC
jgi:uncharacterized membrane protein (UPF0127 family)